MKAIHHKHIIENMDALCKWYKERVQGFSVPIYSSYDIRDSGNKIVNVDANIYPAGFNNICPTDKDSAVEIMDNYITQKYGSECKNILIISEEHTNNLFYWDNIDTIKTLIESTSRKAMVSIPQKLSIPLELSNSYQKKIKVFSAYPTSDSFSKYTIDTSTAGDKSSFTPDLIISNNDFSNDYQEWVSTLNNKVGPNGTPMNPPRELGWYQRKKSNYFKFYNQFANEFAEVTKLNPFSLTVETQLFNNFDINNEESRKALAQHVEKMISNLKKTYLSQGIHDEPFVFVKNNAGTYGLAVIKVTSAADVLDWTYKSRKKMKAAKGGREISEVIIQEGVPSIIQSDGASAEPVIYMIGCELAGGFLRAHADKSGTDSLNSPGAVYKRLCVTDLLVDSHGCANENVYGWNGKIGLLAIAHEARSMGISF